MWPAPNLVWEVSCFLRCSPVEGRIEESSPAGLGCTHEILSNAFVSIMEICDKFAPSELNHCSYG